VLSDSFSTVTRASGPVFKFCAPRLIFGGTEGVDSSFHVLRPDSFSAVPGASSPVFKVCASSLIFDGTAGIGSRFIILRSRTRFLRSRGRRLLFSCFARPDSFSAVPRASGPVFMFCASGLIFGCTEGVGSRFHFLSARTRFRRSRWRRVPFSCFARRDSFSAISTGVSSCFHILCPRTHFQRYRGRRVPFLIFARPIHFRRYRWRQVSFSCFARVDSFRTVPRASAPVF
jgi:hypothetical protein